MVSGLVCDAKGFWCDAVEVECFWFFVLFSFTFA